MAGATLGIILLVFAVGGLEVGSPGITVKAVNATAMMWASHKSDWIERLDECIAKAEAQNTGEDI